MSQQTFFTTLNKKLQFFVTPLNFFAFSHTSSFSHMPIPVNFFYCPTYKEPNFSKVSFSYYSNSSARTSLNWFRNFFLPAKFKYTYLHLKGIGFKIYSSKLSNSFIVSSGYNHYTKLTFPKLFSFLARKVYVICYSNSVLHSYYINVIKNIRFPDPYRAKGFRLRNQIIKLKVGKQRL